MSRIFLSEDEKMKLLELVMEERINISTITEEYRRQEVERIDKEGE